MSPPAKRQRLSVNAYLAQRQTTGELKLRFKCLKRVNVFFPLIGLDDGERGFVARNRGDSVIVDTRLLTKQVRYVLKKLGESDSQARSF